MGLKDQRDREIGRLQRLAKLAGGQRGAAITARGQALAGIWEEFDTHSCAPSTLQWRFHVQDRPVGRARPSAVTAATVKATRRRKPQPKRPARVTLRTLLARCRRGVSDAGKYVAS